MAQKKQVKVADKAQAQAVMERYRGQYLQVTALLMELARMGTFVTRDTARKWMQEFGCEHQKTGLYWVPAKALPQVVPEEATA